MDAAKGRERYGGVEGGDGPDARRLRPQLTRPSVMKGGGVRGVRTQFQNIQERCVVVPRSSSLLPDHPIRAPPPPATPTNAPRPPSNDDTAYIIGGGGGMVDRNRLKICSDEGAASPSMRECRTSGRHGAVCRSRSTSASRDRLGVLMRNHVFEILQRYRDKRVC